MDKPNYQLIPLGDQAIMVQMADQIDPQENQRLQAIARLISGPEILGIVPAYSTLTVNFDAQQTTMARMMDRLDEVIQQSLQMELPPAKTWLIPVSYGGEFGPDLGDVADFAQISPADVIKRHTDIDYLIYFLGFLPGFSYMGSVDQQIAMPRLATPRLSIPAGSIGIAGQQTGFYPVTSPGGWRLIGQTPIQLYDPQSPQSFYQAGDYVRFVPVNQREFKQIQDAAERDQYQVEVIDHA
ncbi:5-oxoprolinase subunit PxpB [Limosilactobacillus gastricus]|uniref:Allophanate hydrolase subunit 1 n=1 Tax=Limosilactobacillus gastricus DSM 16045 TaxID=1423749 RepID=A0A0R1V6K3_9LACO|nr:5-oxoprolinase subunit PxpB [Limosilactobacillus gastricus]KRM00805.1 Allophanate hydrolase subunit 1 [Limosilactobacillus gastricus DSM 16045]QGF40297.1 5-oxoprolinase subunit PxpB [Limosilactobacillus gastricus]